MNGLQKFFAGVGLIALAMAFFYGTTGDEYGKTVGFISVALSMVVFIWITNSSHDERL